MSLTPSQGTTAPQEHANKGDCGGCTAQPSHTFFPLLRFFHLTYSIADGPQRCHIACDYLRIFPSLPGARLTNFYRDASSALLQLVNQWLNFTYSRTNAFRYGRQNKIPAFDMYRTHDFRTSTCAGYRPDHSGDGGDDIEKLEVWVLRTHQTLGVTSRHP